MEASHSVVDVRQSGATAEREVARPRVNASHSKAPADSIGWLFVMPVTLALLVVFTILFPLR